MSESQTPGYSHDDLVDDGYELLEAFLFQAPKTHRFTKMFIQSESDELPGDFVDNVRNDSEFGRALVEGNVRIAAGTVEAQEDEVETLRVAVEKSSSFSVEGTILDVDENKTVEVQLESTKGSRDGNSPNLVVLKESGEESDEVGLRRFSKEALVVAAPHRPTCPYYLIEDDTMTWIPNEEHSWKIDYIKR